MKQVLFFLFLNCCLIPHLHGQQLSQTVRGQVVDAESRMPLIGANVVIIGTDPLQGSATDTEGYFRIEKVPVGRHNLRISYLGYEDAWIHELLVGAGKEIVLNIELTESVLLAEGITITAEADKGDALNDMAVVSARMFTVEETKRYAASVNDPARMAMNFAGVAANTDLQNDIVIRGNSPRGLLWRIEGIEVPNPNHFASTGSSGGGISILSANMLANSDFFTGAFPAEYGNALSGVFDIKLRNGNNEKREYALQAGILGLDFAFEGPFSKEYNGSYLVNYRYSTLAAFDLLGIDVVGDAVPKFQDLSFKLKLPTKKLGSFSIWGLGGKSSQAETTNDYRYNFLSDMGALGVNHVLFLDKKTYLESVISFSASRSSYVEDQFDDPSLPELVYQDNLVNRSFRVSTLFNRKFNAKNTLRTGVIFSQLGFNLFSEGEDGGEIKRYIDNQGSSQLYQSYAQWKHRFNEKLTLNTGLHYTFLGISQQQSLEPRLGLRWQFTPKQSLNIGYGVHSRIHDMTIYFAQRFVGDRFYQINKNLALTKANHYVIGYDNMLSKDLHLKVEVYYQQLKNAPISPDFYDDPEKRVLSGLNATNGFTTDSLVSEGTGRNYGLEITFEKFFTNNYYFLLTTSLFESKYDDRDDIERNTRFNNRYIFNVLGGKEFKVGKDKNNLIGLNMKGVLVGGNRYVPANVPASIAEQRAIYEWDQAFEPKVDDYFRIDFRLSYRKNKNKHATIISLDIQNLTNRENIYTQYFDEDDLRVETITQLGLLPVLNYRLEF